MIFTDAQIQAIADQMRVAGFDISEMDNDEIEKMASCILYALDFEAKPNWEDAPEWARYLCREHDGVWRWHETKPSMFYGDYVSSGMKVTVRREKFETHIEERP